jgi:hypothetical protein
MKPVVRAVRLSGCVMLLNGLFLLLPLRAAAQPQFQAGGGFTLAFPQDEFKENVDAVGIGGSGHFAYRFGGSPFLVGLAGGFWIYGSDTWSAPFINAVPVTVDVTTTNSIVRGDLMLRVQPQTGTLRPYIDGFLGFNYLSTSTSVKDQSDNEDIASSTNYDDSAFGAGFGAGVMVCVHDASAGNPDGGLQSVLVDFGVRSLRGGEAEYLKKGSIQSKEGGGFSYDVFRSATDMVTFHLGVTFDFTIRTAGARDSD